MIDHLDVVLRKLLRSVSGIRSDSQVRFQAPDDEWRTAVANLRSVALNVYLADLRENRDLRSNERARALRNGFVFEELAPARVDCSYLISAWSPATPTEQVEPALDEHALLYRTLAVLQQAAPFNPSRICQRDPDVLAGLPELIRDADLPTAVLPPEGFGKLAEFWGTMGPGHRWKPVIQLTVTLPVAREAADIGPPVTTQILEVATVGSSASADTRLLIAGTVRDAADATLAGAWIALETRDGVTVQATTTDPTGRFAFQGAQSGPYRLRVRLPGLEERINDIQVPSGSGAYDVRFD